MTERKIDYKKKEKYIKERENKKKGGCQKERQIIKRKIRDTKKYRI